MRGVWSPEGEQQRKCERRESDGVQGSWNEDRCSSTEAPSEKKRRRKKETKKGEEKETREGQEEEKKDEEGEQEKKEREQRE